MGTALDFAFDETRAFENLDVLRGRGQRHCEWFRKTRNGLFPVSQFAEHGTARGIGEGMEDAIEGYVFNHLVE